MPLSHTAKKNRLYSHPTAAGSQSTAKITGRWYDAKRGPKKHFNLRFSTKI